MNQNTHEKKNMIFEIKFIHEKKIQIILFICAYISIKLS